jgi:hypothetical protein
MADEYELPLRMFGKLTESFLRRFCLGYAKSGQRGERDERAGSSGSTKRFSSRDCAARIADAPGEVDSFHTFFYWDEPFSTSFLYAENSSQVTLRESLKPGLIIAD